MTRILFTTTPFGAHVRMTAPVVRELVAGGHEVMWYTGREFAPLATRLGASFTPAVDAQPDPAQRAQNGAKPPAGLIQLFFKPIPEFAADLEKVFGRFGPDVVVCDTTFRAGIFVAERHDIPRVALPVGPLDVSSVDTAPFGTGLPPPSSARDRLRNRWRYRQMHRACRELQTEAERIRADLGLPPIGGYVNDWVAKIAHCYLQPCVPEFEYPRSDLPASVRFVGLLRETGIDDDWTPPPWWPDLERARSQGRPVAFVTQGTITTDPANLLLPAATALAQADLLLIATTSGRDPDTVLPPDRRPPNLRMADFIPYPAILPRADVVITNGGYGGVQLALSHGIPLVVSGTTEDKPETNMRVAFTGAGISLRTNAPAPAQLASAVHEVLTSPAYRASAQHLKEAYERYSGAPAAAASILETAHSHQPAI